MVNKFILQGRLTADPEIRQTQTGVSCANFTVAWSEKYKEVESKCFQRCRAWRGTADFLSKYFRKGQELIVVGRMLTDQWEKDGQKFSDQVLTADEISFCGYKKEEQSPGNGYIPDAYAAPSKPSGTAAGQPVQAPQFETVDDDQLPF